MPIFNVTMNVPVNYEDNMFLAGARIRLLMDTLCLEAAPGLFLDKSLDDLDFIDRVMAALLESLIENRLLIDREEALDNMADLEWRFDQLLTTVSRGSSTISGVRFPNIMERLVQFQKNSSQRRRNIEETRAPIGQAEPEPVVSSHELNELLREFQV